MIRRLFMVAMVAVALLALVIYSQMRPHANYVTGLIEAEEIRLGSRVGGRVQAVLISEGDRVTASMPLIVLEAYDLKEREQQAIANLAERAAVLKKMLSGMRPEEIAQAKSRYDQALSLFNMIQEGPRSEEVSAAENRLISANAQLRLAQREHDRNSGLFERSAISKSEFDLASEKLEVAISTVGVRQNELTILQAGARKQELEIAKAKGEDLRLAWQLAKKGFRIEEIEQATAARDAAVSALGAIVTQQKELTIKAPTDGTIDSLDLQPGDLVGPNAPVMTMLSNQKLWVRAYVPQRFLQLRMGQTLRVTVDSFPEEEFSGEVTFISRQAEFTPSNVQTPDDRARQVYRIRVTLDESAEKLRPGMTANVWLDAVDDRNE